jgi:hypothetical protein
MEEIRFLHNFPITVDEAEVWRWLGSHGRKGDPKLADVVIQARSLAADLLETKAVYVRVKVKEISSAGVTLANGEKLDGADGSFLANEFAGAEEVVINVATIGPRIEARVQELFAQKKPLEAVTLDAAGSAASSAASRFVNGVIYQQAAQEGMKAGRIFRPGNQHWDLIGQRTLFAIMPAETIGVTLTSSCLILPRKSSSGVIPVGRNLIKEHAPAESSCRRCPNIECIARWEGTSPATAMVQEV